MHGMSVLMPLFLTLFFFLCRYGQGTGPILLDDVNCFTSSSTLISCSHNGIGLHNCQHFEDVAVVCTDSNSKSHFSGWFLTSIKSVHSLARRQVRIQQCILWNPALWTKQPSMILWTLHLVPSVFTCVCVQSNSQKYESIKGTRLYKIHSILQTFAC